MKKLLLAASVSAIAIAPVPANAALIAIFGDNNINDLYSAGGHTTTIVSDAQLATAGFLDSFDLFVYTRDGFSFGQSLSVAAAANVKAYVTGNIVLFNGDFQDDIGAANTDLLFNNALDYVLSGSGGGYIGEYRGAFGAYSANGDGDNPIGLVNGMAGPSGAGQGGSNLDIDITPFGVGNPVTDGVSFPYDPAAVEFGAALSGENPTKVLARFANGNAAIIASEAGQISGAVPEPATWAFMIFGFGAIGGALRSNRRRQRKANVKVSYA
ncbi:hypothetical protein GCM10009096_29430 [Parasphingorhabdus litoris]|uniref:Ice-binding protein C-terminal domain-containing protein n=1 Tax=Parasphingorhabdus litoris TaxID=394733 RepID=A0ABN1AWG2_9SPHN|nr:PEPxxWA-CTERM sorting domain-containing protein [Parasphingorhabdus litoris]